ncbi:DUF998 domain-containing protein [Coralloluteibacterium thermophilus]|uniref:DUF998 domain-containing protein n=1 Tax=Coralloluteibacterium thermophilum TaxID=2707049 RepID=A0ABV9NN67_9GAMM
MPRPFACLALLSLAAFLLAAVSVHALRPELDWVHSQMSVYLVGPWGWLLQSAYAALAAGMLALGVGLYRGLPVEARSAAPLLLFALGAPALVVTALAPMRFPHEDPRLVHLVHGIAAQTTFLCATTGMVLQALRLRLDPAWRPIARGALAWALLCFAGVWLLAFWRDLPRGLAQKGLIAMIVAWLAVVAGWALGRGARREE